MSTRPTKQDRALEYRGRALEASTLAKAAVLDRVRERHEAAAARWGDLAQLNEREAILAIQRVRTRRQTISLTGT